MTQRRSYTPTPTERELQGYIPAGRLGVGDRFVHPQNGKKLTVKALAKTTRRISLIVEELAYAIPLSTTITVQRIPRRSE